MSAWGRRRVRIVVVALIALPLLAWLAVTLVVKWTVAQDVPLGDLFGYVAAGLAGNLICSVTGCEAELPAEMRLSVFDDRLVESTLVALDVDEAGRVFVAEAHRQNRGVEDNRQHPDWLMDDLAARTTADRRVYTERAIREGRIASADHFTREADRLVLLEDRDADGVADARTEVARFGGWLSGLLAGVEVREGTLWVTSIPSIHRLRDEDGDGVAEARTRLHSGFGVKTSLNGHDLHGLAWGPDGKLYFSLGDRGYSVRLADGRVLEPSMGPGRGAVFRMHADGRDLEVFATGLRNPQELAFDAFGNLFTGDNNGDGGDAARLVYLVEGSETGWAMPFQSLAGDYLRGPWMAERLWDLQHETQPAWVLPPIGHIGRGPAGFVHYPGLGLPERYQDHFFLCDYAYLRGRSGIWSFAVEPRGAGFAITDAHPFVWSLLATDLDFSWDGRIFASVFDQLGGSQQVVTLEHAESRADPRVAELTAIVRTPMAEKTTQRLFELLSFPDQRLRLRAQFELAARAESERLAAFVRDRSRPLIPRLHALWALGQIGPAGLQAIATDGFDGLSGEGDGDGESEWERAELRAQLARTVGNAKAPGWSEALRANLRDPSARVRFFSAQALGAIGERADGDDGDADENVRALIELLRDNGDRDVFLRHAAVWALHRLGQHEAVLPFAEDPDRSVRLGVLLVLRHAGDPRIARFLGDPDPLLVVEAARAIYDLPIDGAMAALADLSRDLARAAAQDRQTGQALHRRVIGALLRLRTVSGAAALAEYAADESQLRSLRDLALETLGDYAEPGPRDLTQGFHRPLARLDPSRLAGVWSSQGRRLIDSTVGARALEIASRNGYLTLSDEELLERALGTSSGRAEAAEETTVTRRTAALEALRQRVQADRRVDRAAATGLWARPAAEQALASELAVLRMAGRALLSAIDPREGLATDLALLGPDRAAPGAEVAEQKQAWLRLGEFDDPAARERIARGLADWEADRLPLEVALEVRAAALAQTDPKLAARARLAFAADPDRPLESRRWALAGGDAQAGRRVFETTGDCRRCHVAGSRRLADLEPSGAGHDPGAGPALFDVAREADAAADPAFANDRERRAWHVLESLVEPDAQIVEGFGSIVVTRTDGSRVSGLLVRETPEGLTIDHGAAEPIEIARSDIAARSEIMTGMPPIGRALEPEALRDVIAYVLSLR